MSGKKKAALFESDSDSEEDEPKAGTSKSGGFTINESYANIYDGFRRKEQLQKLKDRYGDNAGEGDGDDDDDETSSSSEDEDAEEITKENEVEFFAAISALKEKESTLWGVPSFLIFHLMILVKFPLAGGPILQLPTAQAGPRNWQQRTKQNMANEGMRNAVIATELL